MVDIIWHSADCKVEVFFFPVSLDFNDSISPVQIRLQRYLFIFFFQIYTADNNQFTYSLHKQQMAMYFWQIRLLLTTMPSFYSIVLMYLLRIHDQ